MGNRRSLFTIAYDLELRPRCFANLRPLRIVASLACDSSWSQKNTCRVHNTKVPFLGKHMPGANTKRFLVSASICRVQARRVLVAENTCRVQTKGSWPRKTNAACKQQKSAWSRKTHAVCKQNVPGLGGQMPCTHTHNGFLVAEHTCRVQTQKSFLVSKTCHVQKHKSLWS